MSSLNAAISREILHINDRLSSMANLFTVENGLLEYLVDNHSLARSEVISRDLPMSCIVTRYQFQRLDGRVFIDVRSNHHVLEHGTLNFDAAVVGVLMVMDNRIYEPLIYTLDPARPDDRKVWSTVTTFLRALLPDADLSETKVPHVR